MIVAYFFVKKGRCNMKKEPTVDNVIVFEEVVGDIQNNIIGIYHGVTKRDLLLFLNE